MSFKLWICEKPSVARVVASALGKTTNKDGYIEIQGGEHVVSWCVGHVLSTLEPDEYDEKYKKWVYQDLPIIPTEWKLKVTPTLKKQVSILKDLLKKASSIVNVGDPDREGQLLVDELLIYCKADKKPTTRCFISNMNMDKVKKSIKESEKQKNSQFYGLYESGLGRQRADWLIGMNCSRAATLMAQRNGFGGVVTIGRVQTPTLALIVNRDNEIKNFVPVNYFNINAIFNKENKDFKARWIPKGTTLEKIQQKEILNKSEEVTEEELDKEDEIKVSEESSKPKWLDENDRLIDENIAKQIVKKIEQAKVGKVVKYKKETKNETRPKLFNLSALQSEMSKYGLSSDQTLELCQKLYEAGYLTYPRSDSRYLPTSLKGDVKGILQALNNISDFRDFIPEAKEDTKNLIWNDKETSVHHAIIPTSKKPLLGNFSDHELQLYMSVSKQFLANFLPDCISDNARIDIKIADEDFVVNGKIIKQEGWKKLFKNDNSKKKNNKSENEEQELPILNENDEVDLKEINYVSAQTTPPSLFIDGKFPEIMEKVYTLIKDEELRKKMKQLKGIGTEATRAKIIADLKKRGYIEIVDKKYLTATKLGHAIINSLPEQLTSFVLTSQWETFLSMIEKGDKTLQEFETKQKNYITKMIELFEKTNFSELSNLESNIKTKNKKPSTSNAPKTGKKCPKCGGDLVIRTIKNGKNVGKKFIGCSNFSTTKCDFVDWNVD